MKIWFLLFLLFFAPHIAFAETLPADLPVQSQKALMKEVEDMLAPEGVAPQPQIPKGSTYVEETDKKFLIECVAYRKADIIRDFVSTAFSDVLWQQESGNSYPSLFSGLTQEIFQRASRQTDDERNSNIIPWMKEFAEFPNGYPATGVINKWSKDITIAVGWPKYNLGFITSAGEQANNAAYYNAISNTLEKIVPVLHRSTGLNFKIISPEVSAANDRLQGTVRIVPNGQAAPGYIFKGGVLNPFKHGFQTEGDLNQLEYEFFGGVSFTPSKRAQVGGYLLPNPDNSMGAAVCKVRDAAGDAVLQALVMECLVRALGLPEVSALSRGVLRAWNEAMEKAYEQKLQQSTEHQTGKGARDLLDSVDKSSIPTGINGYDLFLARLLYCADIKPGMSKLSVIAVLSQSDKCFISTH